MSQPYQNITTPAVTTAESNYKLFLRAADFQSDLIDGTANGFANGGGKLRAYSSSAKTTQYSMEVLEFVTGGTPSIALYILLPSIATGGSSIYIEDDPVATVQPAVTAAYGRNSVWADHVAVLHLTETGDGTSGEYEDSTGNGYTGKAGSASQAPATETTNNPFGGNWQHFDGTDDYIIIEGSANTLDSSDLSISLMVRRDAAGDSFDEAIVSNQQTASSFNIVAITADSAGTHCKLNDGTETYTTSTYSTVSTNTWLTVASGSSGWKLNANGTTIVSHGTQRQFTNSYDFWLGRYYDDNSNRRWDGNQAEVRFKTTEDSLNRNDIESDNYLSTTGWVTIDSWAKGGAGGASAALTGQSLSTAQGSLGITSDVALSGALTCNVGIGTLATDISTAISGESLSLAQGLLGTTTVYSAALTGQALSVAEGTLLVAIDTELSDQSTAISQGSVGTLQGVFAELTGQSLSVSEGTIAAVTDIAISGQVVSVAQGTIVPESGTLVALTGQSLSAEQGSVATVSDAALTGQALSVARGFINLPGASVSTGLGGSGGGGSSGKILSARKLNAFIDRIGQEPAPPVARRLTKQLLQLEPSAESLRIVLEALASKDLLSEASSIAQQILADAQSAQLQMDQQLEARMLEEAELEEAAIMLLLLN